MAAPKIEWKVFAPGYSVSNMGKVRSEDRTIKTSKGFRRYKGRALSAKGQINGYPVVNIKGKAIKVHKIVAEQFLLNPNNLPVINHKNGNKTDNRLDNLERCTQQDNCLHAYKVLKRPAVINKGFSNGFSKVVLNTSTGVFYGSISMAANSTNIKRSTLGAMLRGENRNYTNFIIV